jgi:hypothetical protein
MLIYFFVVNAAKIVAINRQTANALGRISITLSLLGIILLVIAISLYYSGRLSHKSLTEANFFTVRPSHQQEVGHTSTTYLSHLCINDGN